MKNQKIMFTAVLLTLACSAVSPAALAARPSPTPTPSENRGNGNSAAENVDALNINTTGQNNTAHGWHSLSANTEGSDNTANGFGALFSNTTGSQNSAIGLNALKTNTTGYYNTAIGYYALYQNDGIANSAVGMGALLSNTTGIGNTSVGAQALSYNTTGALNVAIGMNALERNSTGNSNVAIGNGAGQQQSTGSNNIYIGQGLQGVAGESDSCYIGSIFGQTSAGGTPVYINSAGKLGTTTSSQRFKEDIKPMNTASEALFALKPVTFRYKKEIDPQGIPQFGLVAEDVEKVNPELVVRDKDGKVNTVRYEAVNAMLLNEFLKEHKKVEAQQATIRQLKSNAASQEATISELKEGMGTLTAQVKEQAAQIQKVSAPLEIRKPLTRVALSNP